MKLNISIQYQQNYLPSKRHRKETFCMVHDTVEVEVAEPTAEEFPVAFIVSDYMTVYKNAKSYKEFYGNGEFCIFDETIRTYNGKLFKPVRITYGAAISTCFEEISNLKNLIGGTSYCINKGEMPEGAILTSNDRDEMVAESARIAEYYVVFDNIIWQTCSEPCYYVQTFGCGGNHGGTSLFIGHVQQGECWANKWAFNALQREEAVACGRSVAEKRRDTEDVDRIGGGRNIKVLLPELVTLDPQRDYRMHQLKTFKEHECFTISLEGLTEVLKELLEDDTVVAYEASGSLVVSKDNKSFIYENDEIIRVLQQARFSYLYSKESTLFIKEGIVHFIFG